MIAAIKKWLTPEPERCPECGEPYDCLDLCIECGVKAYQAQVKAKEDRMAERIATKVAAKLKDQ